MVRKALLFTLAALASLLAGPGTTHAGFLLSGPGTGTGFSNPVSAPVQLIGFEFTVGPTPLLVTQLGTYDFAQNGLAGAEQVRLWATDGTLLADVTIPAGTTAPLIGDFRYVDLLTPALLSPGQSYILGTTNVADIYIANTSAQIVPFVAPEVTFVQGRRNLGEGDFSGFAADPITRIGPNLAFTAVPEPGSLMLFGTGTAVLAGHALRRRKSVTPEVA